MYQTRLIPVLLLWKSGFVKTIKFKNPKYIGDPINILRLFNDKQVDEIVVLDITPPEIGKKPQYGLIENITSECFMPLCYGGGVKNIEQMKKLFSLGIEKISINSSAANMPELISQAAKSFGSQSIVVSIDVSKNLFGKYEVVTENGKKRFGIDPVSFARKVEILGAGEILLNSINNDGVMKGYDLKLINQVSQSVDIPVIACGGAGDYDDFRIAITEGCASAVAAGSMFVYQGKHKAVLVNYPLQEEIKHIFKLQGCH